MIKANEWRIGNWILFEGKPTQITINSFKRLLDFDSESDYEGITLTPEILERCGFVVNTELGLTSDRKKRIVYEFDGLYISFEDNSSFIWNEMEDSFLSSAYPEIKYLHTLQNKFYFDKLTGEELVIKELQTA